MLERVKHSISFCRYVGDKEEKVCNDDTRHILATELRIKFVPLMEKLFDENILLVKLSSDNCKRLKIYGEEP
jgi:hypothetical protein